MTEANITKETMDQLSEKLESHEPTNLWKDAFDRLKANRLAIFGIVVILILLLVAIFGPFITPYDFLDQNMDNRYQPPSSAHWLGTDDLGRDILSRVIYGARTATIVAISVTTVSLTLGILLGSIAGYTGGGVDSFIMWITDMTMSIPSLLLAVVINLTLKTPIVYWMDDMYLETQNPFFLETIWVDFALVFGALAFVMWPGYARLIRGQILSVRKENYVLSAKALGLSNRRILFRHVLPNSLGPVIVQASAGLGSAMVLESAFSFLGVGVRPPIPSWGNMIQDGLRVWTHFPHVLAAPAIVLAIVTIAFNFLGDGLNDALNPKGWR